RLARQFGLVATIQEATVEQLRQFLAEGKQAMAFIDRAVFDLTPRQRAKHSLRAAEMHVGVPTRITADAVTYSRSAAPGPHRPQVDPPLPIGLRTSREPLRRLHQAGGGVAGGPMSAEIGGGQPWPPT